MKKLFTLLFSFGALSLSQAQTTVYTTGQTYPDAWTGWSAPVTSNITSNSVNGANIYTFAGNSGSSYTIETYRQFTINSNDLDFYLTATTESCLVSIEFSTDNVTYTLVGSQMWGAGFAVSTLIAPTFDPGVTTFYIKLKMAGTFASPSQANFNSLKIDAVLNSVNSVSVAPVATQNINTGVNGTVLTATEAPSAAGSREWKYSTTSGSGYVSFGSAQTGLTYTPNFATAGTYYVVCISDFSGDIQTSNEVRINVGTASVEEHTVTNSAYFYNGILTINSSLSNYAVTVFDITGQLIYSGGNSKMIDLTSINSGLYFVTIATDTQRKTLKVVKE